MSDVGALLGDEFRSMVRPHRDKMGRVSYERLADMADDFVADLTDPDEREAFDNWAYEHLVDLMADGGR